MQPMKKPKVVIQHMLALQIWQEYRDLMIRLAENIAPFCKIVSFNNKGIFDQIFSKCFVKMFECR